VLKQQGAVIVDPATFRASSTRTRPEFPALAGVSRRGRSEGHGCRLLGRFKYGMKARLQQMAAEPCPTAACENADRIAPMEPRACAGGRAQVRAIQLDISDEMEVEADRERLCAVIAQGVALSAMHGIDEVHARRTARRAAVSRRYGALPFRATRLPTVIVPFGMRPICATAIPTRIRAKPSAFG